MNHQDDDALFGRPPLVLRAGAVLLPGWLDAERQRRLLHACREWARGAAGLHRPSMPDGTPMRVQSVCLGWHYSLRHGYTRTTAGADGTPVKPLPGWLAALARRAVVEAAELDDELCRRPQAHEADAAIVNFYDDEARLGMHQDRAEKSGAPVVSLSLGNSCVFRFGNNETRTRPWQDLTLRSGDLFVFGGPGRMAHHSVVRTLPGTAPAELGIRGGRVSVTLRETGLVAHLPKQRTR
ncbi:alpha-ketoglutarate-dependent dioxygenase AlkB [Streptomyces sp. NPDC006446]|uniref:alpha-ketoglutarate-dependent dioxygenase AlkB n=1 Tax=Streptomyces sp. NPDC006446 TaxID=3154301 RepID=UPI0033B37FDE